MGNHPAPNNKGPHSFIDYLNLLTEKAKSQPKLTVKDIFRTLKGKGYAALIVLFSFPFCLPVQIPGFSTPFGLILAFLGLRMTFANHLWWPKWVLNREVESGQVIILSEKLKNLFNYIQKLIHPRILFLTKNNYFKMFNGMLVFILSILLSLPLPIPLTNLLSAIPLLFIGLGLLEEDGIFILLGYLFSIICITSFIAIFIFGKNHLVNYLY